MGFAVFVRACCELAVPQGQEPGEYVLGCLGRVYPTIPAREQGSPRHLAQPCPQTMGTSMGMGTAWGQARTSAPGSGLVRPNVAAQWWGWGWTTSLGQGWGPWGIWCGVLGHGQVSRAQISASTACECPLDPGSRKGKLSLFDVHIHE